VAMTINKVMFSVFGMEFKYTHFMLIGAILHWLLVGYEVVLDKWLDVVCYIIIGVCCFVLYMIMSRQDAAEKMREPEPINYIPASAIRFLPCGHYVYVIRDIDVTGYYKIGKTTNVARRFNEFKLTLPFQIGIVLVLDCQDERVLELQLHRHFRDKHVKGEWFDLDDDDLDYIRQVARQQE
jgi:hypothetical protein